MSHFYPAPILSVSLSLRNSHSLNKIETTSLRLELIIVAQDGLIQQAFCYHHPHLSAGIISVTHHDYKDVLCVTSKVGIWTLVSLPNLSSVSANTTAINFPTQAFKVNH